MPLATWSQAIACALAEFADAEYQERVWLHGKGPEVSSYEEAVNRLYDDYDVEGFLALPEVQSQPPIAEAITAFCKALETTPEPQDRIDETWLSSVYWHHVREKAAHAREKLANAKW
jgi:hypothetical protein